LLIVSLVTVLRGTVLSDLPSGISAEEIANYVTDGFIQEPDLWRVHLRTILGLIDVIEATTVQGDEAAEAVRKAQEKVEEKARASQSGSASVERAPGQDENPVPPRGRSVFLVTPTSGVLRGDDL
jgi:hypothetical protein